MIRCEGEVSIDRDLHTVFSFLADPTRIPEWRADIVASTPLEGHGVGALYRETMRFLGMQTQTFRVVEHRTDACLAFQAIDGPSVRPLQRFVIEPAGRSTRVRYEIALPVTGWFRLVRPLLERMIPRKWGGYAIALKLALER
jgi:hypothetical protein